MLVIFLQFVLGSLATYYLFPIKPGARATIIKDLRLVTSWAVTSLFMINRDNIKQFYSILLSFLQFFYLFKLERWRLVISRINIFNMKFALILICSMICLYAVNAVPAPEPVPVPGPAPLAEAAPLLETFSGPNPEPQVNPVVLVSLAGWKLNPLGCRSYCNKENAGNLEKTWINF